MFSESQDDSREGSSWALGFQSGKRLTSANFKRGYVLVRIDFFYISTRWLLVKMSIQPYYSIIVLWSRQCQDRGTFLKRALSTPCLCKSREVPRFTHIRPSIGVALSTSRWGQISPSSAMHDELWSNQRTLDLLSMDKESARQPTVLLIVRRPIKGVHKALIVQKKKKEK